MQYYEKISSASSILNISMINQWNKFYDNSKELKDLKYPSNLPVLAFLTKKQIKDVDEMINCGAMQTSWIQMNDNMITNANIQTRRILEGENFDTQSGEIVKASIEFIKKFVNTR